MRTRSKLLTLLAAVAVLAVAVGTANAGRFSTSEQRFRITWSSFELGGFTELIRCRVTLEGSFHSRSFAKVAEALVGYITGGTIAHPCTGGEQWLFNGREVQNGTTLANTLPWHLRYESFSGSLPNITELSFKVVGMRLLRESELFGIRLRCTYTTTAAEPFRGPWRRNTTSRVVTEFELGGAVRSESGGGCPTSNFIGTGPITTPAGGSITVTLI
ncbi:MAG: hypothetical protein JSS99_08200 [Actinobacteria bacterium]|nr:hypothetical protein [Actinomycetota bacterium]